MEYSRDGNRIVAGSSSDGTGEIRVYDVASGSLLAKSAGDPGPIYAARFSPDGKQVAAAGFAGKVMLDGRGDGQADQRIRAGAAAHDSDNDVTSRSGDCYKAGGSRNGTCNGGNKAAGSGDHCATGSGESRASPGRSALCAKNETAPTKKQ